MNPAPPLCVFSTLRFEKRVLAGTDFRNQAVSISPASIEEPCRFVARTLLQCDGFAEAKPAVVITCVENIAYFVSTEIKVCYFASQKTEQAIASVVIKDDVLV